MMLAPPFGKDRLDASVLFKEAADVAEFARDS